MSSNGSVTQKTSQKVPQTCPRWAPRKGPRRGRRPAPDRLPKGPRQPPPTQPQEKAAKTRGRPRREAHKPQWTVCEMAPPPLWLPPRALGSSLAFKTREDVHRRRAAAVPNYSDYLLAPAPSPELLVDVQNVKGHSSPSGRRNTKIFLTRWYSTTPVSPPCTLRLDLSFFEIVSFSGPLSCPTPVKTNFRKPRPPCPPHPPNTMLESFGNNFRSVAEHCVRGARGGVFGN